MMIDTSPQDVFETADGEVRVVLEQGSSIHLKAASAYNDPVELTATQALEIADILLHFASRLGA